MPRREDRPTMGLRCAKNFVTSNAVEAILAVPANRRRPPIDYLKKEDYGRVPVRDENYWRGYAAGAPSVVSSGRGEDLTLPTRGES